MKIRIPTDAEYQKLCDITNENDALMHWNNMGSWVDDVEISPLSTCRAYRGRTSAHKWNYIWATYRRVDVGFRPAVEGVPDTRVPDENGMVVLGTFYVNGKPVRVPQNPAWGGDVEDYTPGAILEMREPLDDPDYQVKGFVVSEGVAVADRALLENISFNDCFEATLILDKEDDLKWLLENMEHGIPACCKTKDGGLLTLVKIKATESFDFIYSAVQYQPFILDRRDLSLALICKGDEIVCSVKPPYQLKEVLSDELLSEEDWGEVLYGKVQDRLNSIIKSKDDLQVKTLNPGSSAERDVQYVKNASKRFVEQLVKEGKTPPTGISINTPAVSTYNSFKKMSDFLDFLSDQEKYVMDKTDEFISKYQEHLLSQFIINDAVQQAYDELMTDKSNPAFTIAAIANTMKALPNAAKKVRVSVEMPDGAETTGSCDAYKVCSGQLTLYDFEVAVRPILEAGGIHGWSEIDPRSIVRVQYRGKTVYERAQKEE